MPVYKDFCLPCSAGGIYPLPSKRACEIFEVGLPLEDLVTEATLAVHLWKEKLTGLKHRAPEPGSFLRRLYDRFGL